MKEEWRAIVIEKNGVLYDYTGLYEVSNLGNVRSLGNGNSGASKDKLLKLYKNEKGYLRVYLHKDGKKDFFSVHRLVASVFIPNPSNLETVNHKNEIINDNRVENLEWMSNADNECYSKNKKVVCIETGEVFDSIKEANKWCNGRHVGCCCRGVRATCGGYHWKFVD